MNITFTDEELRAITDNDYSIFDHELSTGELKAAIRQIFEEKNEDPDIVELKNKVHGLEVLLRWKDRRLNMAERLNKVRGEELEELQNRIILREQSLDGFEKKFGELESKYLDTCHALAREKEANAKLKEELEEWEAQHAAVKASQKKAAYMANRLKKD